MSTMVGWMDVILLVVIGYCVGRFHGAVREERKAREARE